MADRIVDVQAALDAGASVDDQDTYGNTPVHLAISRDVLAALLAEVPDLKITNVFGRTAARAQVQAGRGALADIILEFIRVQHVDGPYTPLKY